MFTHIDKIVIVIVILIGILFSTDLSAKPIPFKLLEEDINTATEACADHYGVRSFTPEIVNIQPTHYTVLQLIITCNDGTVVRRYINSIRR